jgi:two-component system CheB/CheR fusion protein
VLRTLATIEKPVRSLDGQTLFMLRMLPYRTADNVINGVVLTFTDITRITAAEVRIAELTADLRARIGELETLLDLVPVGVLVADGTGAEAPVLINTYGARLLGAGDGNKGFRRAVTPLRLFDGRTPLPPEAQPLQLALRSGAAVPGWQGRLEDQAGRSVDVMISATPLFGDTGEVRGAIAAIVEIFPQVQAEAHRRALQHELQHRLENIVASIHALAIRMSYSGLSPEDFVGALLSRLAAMARVESLLADSAWGGASLRSLIEAALEPYRGTGEAATVLAGPDIRLTASAATVLGMVFHELATNAAKHGALAVSGGHVHVQWAEAAPAGAGEADRVLRVVWTERGGPAVAVPPAGGFGTGFVARSLQHELAGAASLEFATGGLVCVLSFPLRGNLETPELEPYRP